MSDDKSVTIPGWWIRIATVSLPILAATFIAAIPWAWSLQSDVSSIRASLEFQKLLHGQTIAEQNRRIEDHEQRIRLMETKVRP
mgnify:CR=1 FL=1